MIEENKVHVLWDGEAEVWVAESDDVPGLVAEAESMEALIEKLKVLIPELLELNGRFSRSHFPLHIFSERVELIPS